MLIVAGNETRKMEYSNTDLGDYAQSLYRVDNFEEAFGLFEKEVLKLGFAGVLYTYIPQVLIDSHFSVNPVYEVSRDYCPDYLEHYTSERFDKNDPLIKAVASGVSEPIDWWGDICQEYMGESAESKEVIATSRHYGITNAVTLPLMAGQGGISGASFISDETRLFPELLDKQLDSLTVCTNLFHSMVRSNACYTGRFAKPLLASLSDTEKRFLIGLALGKTPGQIAVELNTSDKYLEQVMIKIRQKLSGVKNNESPVINRNQVMYYAGLLNILEHPLAHRR